MVSSQLPGDMIFNAAGRPGVPHGLMAAAALPLRADPEAAPFGVLGLYSVEADAFTEEELALLQGLADDLVHGIARCKLHAQCVQQAAAAADRVAQAHPVYYDNLTGLATLATLQRQLAPLTEQAHAARRKLAALYINLDSFDMINEKLGHAVADQLLVQAALRLAQAAGEKAVLARPGADEFIVLLPGLVSAAHAGKIAARVAAALGQEVDAGLLPPDTPQLKLMCSTGIAVYPDDSAGASELLPHALQAMRQASTRAATPTAIMPTRSMPRWRSAAPWSWPWAGRWNAANCCCTTSRRTAWPTAASSARKPCCAGSIRSAACWRRRSSSARPRKPAW